jgi:hypothetical protein
MACNPPPRWLTAAAPLSLSTQQTHKHEGPGCVQAGCASGKTQTVLVTDWCEGCGADVVYVSDSAYRSLVLDSVGQVAGRFRRVSRLSELSLASLR